MAVTFCCSSKVQRGFLLLGLILTHLNVIHNAAKYPLHQYTTLIVPETLSTAIEGVICLRTPAGDNNFKPATSGGFCKRKSSWSSCRVLYYANSVATTQILLLSGDVELNPGWRGISTEGEDYLLNFASEINRGSNNFSIAQLNVRSLRNKMDEIKLLLKVCRFDILAITETFLDARISNKQLHVDNYKIVRRDRNTGQDGGGCLIYIASHICYSRLKSLEPPDVELIWIKIMHNSSALILGNCYRPPSDFQFYERFCDCLEKMWLRHRNVVLVGDFNSDYFRSYKGVTSYAGRRLQDILQQFSYSVMNDRSQPTRVTSETKTLIDLVITSKPEIIKGTIKTTELGISDHKLVLATIWSKIKRPPPKIVRARTFKRFDQATFVKDIESAPWSVCSVFNDPDDCYWAWSRIFKDICQVHAPYREVKIRSVSVPWITPQIRHLMNKRFKMLKMAQRLGDPDLWAEYSELRNRVTREVRLSKSRYYLELFNEVKDCKSYWRLVKNATNGKSITPILGIRNADGKVVTSDLDKANILNEHFSTIGEKLANELPNTNSTQSNVHVSTVTPCVMNINLSQEVIVSSMAKLRADKASGPDRVAPKLLKFAGDSIIPSLLSVFQISATCNSVPTTWKAANISALYKSDDETVKQNYRPISLLSVPGKLMESMVASTITTHVTEQGLGNPHQWAYKKGHSTELLLVKITDDWRQAIDKKHVVGVVFVDFRKAFDAIPHSILLRKLQSLGVAGDLWCWIRDYLSGRTQVTTINGCQSQAMPVTFGVPQGSVLGPTLFSIFCNDLPNITEGIDGDPQLHMYADDTTVYVSAPTYDLVASKLNEVLARLYTWCCENCLTPHPTKTEYILLGGRGKFTGPKQAIKIGDYVVGEVVSARCLGVQIDNALKWDHHVSELAKSYTQKLNLLKSLYFLPIQARIDFYFKVILPSVTYGMLVWGSCGRVFFSSLESIHVRAAKIIFNLDWCTPSKEVLATVKWNTLEIMYEKRLLILAHQAYYNLLPRPMSRHFEKYVSSYDFRRKMTFKLPRPKTDMVKKSCSYKSITRWNALENQMRSIQDVDAFKKSLKCIFKPRML